MEKNIGTLIVVETTIKSTVEKCWEYWTLPEHITKWNFASEDWHTPYAENDLRAGGKFSYRMEAKNGSFGFDFGGVYEKVEVNQFISYRIDDGRKVEISFVKQGEEVKITESFEAESTNSAELQKAGWQSILDNFKKYAENLK